jgi:hypothetical protein
MAGGKSRQIMVGSLATFLVGGGFGSAGVDSHNQGWPIHVTLLRVANAALHKTHGGRAVSAVICDDGNVSVEVLLDDGRLVDVDLDEHVLD